MQLLDIHIHLEDIEQYIPVEEIISNAKKNDVCIMITSGCDPARFQLSLDYAEKFPELKVSLGLYPNRINTDYQKDLRFIEQHKESIIAIGECGLDYGIIKNPVEKELQKKLFVEQIRLAKKLNLPLIVHSGKASDAVLDVLEEECAKHVILHYFEGDAQAIKRAVDNGYYLTISPDIDHYDIILLKAQLVPLQQLLTETDAPVFPPLQVKFNEPRYIKQAVQKLSEIKNISFEECAEKIYENYITLFGEP